jgi:hypothetical protein
MSNLKAYWAVDGEAYWAVSDAVYWAVNDVVYWAVDDAANWAVNWAVDDPDHPALQDFLLEVSAGEGARPV